MNRPAASAIEAIADQLREKLTRSEAGPRGQIASELAALHVVMIEELARCGETETLPVSSLARLAEQFGSIQAQLAASATIAPAPASDEPAQADNGGAELDGWLRTMAASQQRYHAGFALAVIEVDGLERISDAYGPDAAERILSAVAGVIERQIRSADRTFKVDDGEFYVLAPHTRSAQLMPMIERLVELIYNSQAPHGPRIAISAGVVDCPADGSNAEELIVSAHEANYAAKAAGVPAARLERSPVVLQDP